MHRHTIQMNHQLHVTISLVFYSTFIYSSTCFGRPHVHHQCCWSWSGRPARPRPTALLPSRFNGKSEAATAVIELLMMGMRMPETSWAVFKRQVINPRNWCIWLVGSFEFELINQSRLLRNKHHEKQNWQECIRHTILILINVYPVPLHSIAYSYVLHWTT